MSLRGTGLGPTIAKPSAVLSFAEDLMLCPTEESALIRIQRDLEAARGCQIIAGDVASEVGKRHAQISVPTGESIVSWRRSRLPQILSFNCFASRATSKAAWRSAPTRPKSDERASVASFAGNVIRSSGLSNPPDGASTIAPIPTITWWNTPEGCRIASPNGGPNQCLKAATTSCSADLIPIPGVLIGWPQEFPSWGRSGLA